MDATVSIVCFKSKKLSNGEYPLMIRITQGKERAYKSLGLSVLDSLWNYNKEEPKRSHPNYEWLLKIVSQEKQKYLNLIFELRALGKSFTPQTLISKVEKKENKSDVDTYIRNIIELMINEKRLGNAKSYTHCYNSLKTFAVNLCIPFTDIDVAWLKRYERFLRERGNSDNTMGIRFRTLRAVYNKAIEDDIVDEKYYPFKKFKVSHFNKKTTKRAISKSEMAKVLALDLSNITTYYSPLLYLSKDLFVFSYLGCGINMIDMAYLTYSNIIDDRICFKRHKTGQGITFRLLPQTIEIINKYKNEGYSLSDYIFPILDKKFHITEIQQYDRIRKVTKGVNRNLKKIGSFLGLNIPLTTYVARHSFATVLKRSGVNVAIISEALGHTSLSTTQFYLDSFDNEQIDDAMTYFL